MSPLKPIKKVVALPIVVTAVVVDEVFSIVDDLFGW